MFHRCTAVVLLIAIVFPVAYIRADERYVRCESGRNGRYRRCSVDTDGRVELVREFSNRKCRQWRSWGYDGSGVWVDYGCRAEFRVGRDGIGAGGAAVIGAVAGAAIIAAILAGKNRNPESPSVAVNAPGWAQGHFRGFSPKTNSDFDLTIVKNGLVSGQVNGNDLTGYLAQDNRLHLGDATFTLKREDWGFVATPTNDAEDKVYFRRQ
jgi:hypothetical protein